MKKISQNKEIAKNIRDNFTAFLNAFLPDWYEIAKQLLDKSKKQEKK